MAMKTVLSLREYEDVLDPADIYSILGRLSKGGRALSPVFGPPRKPKIKSYFTTLSLDCFIRLMIQVFLFHIDLTLMVAMVTENGRQNRLKQKKCHFQPKSGGLTGQIT